MKGFDVIRVENGEGVGGRWLDLRGIGGGRSFSCVSGIEASCTEVAGCDDDDGGKSGTAAATPITGSGDGFSEPPSTQWRREGVIEGALELVDDLREWSKEDFAFGGLGRGRS